jgi:hypothetical protein
MLRHPESEQHVGDLLVAGFAPGDNFEVFGRNDAVVPGLNEKSAGKRTD